MKKPSTPSSSASRSGWSPKSTRQRLSDIEEYARSVKGLLASTSHEAFLEDLILQKAACFDVLCLSEATARLLEIDQAIASRYANVPWRQIADIGNVLRHEYGRIDVTIIFDAVTQGDLDALQAAVLRELET